MYGDSVVWTMVNSNFLYNVWTIYGVPVVIVVSIMYGDSVVW